MVLKLDNQIKLKQAFAFAFQFSKISPYPQVFKKNKYTALSDYDGVFSHAEMDFS